MSSGTSMSTVAFPLFELLIFVIFVEGKIGMLFVSSKFKIKITPALFVWWTIDKLVVQLRIDCQS
jgi:hypothetical protein